MGYFVNNRIVNFEELEKSGVYSELLLSQIKSADEVSLNETITDSQKRSRDFMEPILFAIKNEYNTYKIFKCMGSNLQENFDLAKDIIKEEPELIKGTPVSNNKEFILQAVDINPKVVIFMSTTLKADSKFTEQLCELKDAEVTMYAAKVCKMPDVIQENPNLASNPVFMKEAIKDDPSLLKHADDSLKNNYEFIKETCKENKEVINYVANHTKEFGKEGLTAAKEVLVDNTTSKAINEFKEELVKVESQKEIEKTKENSIKERQLRNNLRFIERIRNGEIKQERAIRLINSICKDLGEEYRQELMKYVKIDDAIIEKQKEDKSDIKIEPQDIEEKTITTSKLDSINQETQIIREEYTKQTKNKEVENVYSGTEEERK